MGSADDERGDFVMRCDECGRFEYDDDAAALPEARRALARALVPAGRKGRAAVRRERALAMEAHALRMSLSAVLANATAATADPAATITRIGDIAREVFER